MIMEKKGSRCVLIIAGEASGDAHGAHLVAAMKRRDPDLFFCGIGGRNMRNEGPGINNCGGMNHF
jgi:lipid-A-disaccharide synthase